MPMTKTQKFLHTVGPKVEDTVWRAIGANKEMKELCKEEDCFHRCSGTDETSYCAMCIDKLRENASKLSDSRVFS